MKDFDKVLNEHLDAMSDGISGEAQGKLDLIHEISKELDGAKERVQDLEMSLRHATEEYNVELARALRKRLPEVGVSLNNGRCSASYKSTNLSCKPDLASKSWVFEPNQHGRRFSKNNGIALGLNNTVDPLADAIVQYFGRYKTLRR
jgi:hypothetical protein